jgi:cold shock CspA family protein/ribosomal protein L12E/L44/L45/RPP1/RPP2
MKMINQSRALSTLLLLVVLVVVVCLTSITTTTAFTSPSPSKMISTKSTLYNNMFDWMNPTNKKKEETTAAATTTPAESLHKDDIADNIHHFLDNIFHPTSYSKVSTEKTVKEEASVQEEEDRIDDNFIVAAFNQVDDDVVDDGRKEQVAAATAAAATTTTTVASAPKDIDEEHSMTTKTYTGKTRWFSKLKGYGFVDIIDDTTGQFVNPDDRTNNVGGVFIHQTDIKSDDPNLFRVLKTNEIVKFEVVEQNNRKKAINVTGKDGDFVREIVKQKKSKKNEDGNNQ